MGLDRRKGDTSRDHVEHALETAALEAARQAARKTAKRAAGGYFLLLLVLFIGAALYQRSTNKQLDSANRRLDQSELTACERVQTQRERTNVSEARQYLLLRAVATSPRASSKVRDRYGALANTTLYDPPTDCPAAVRHPNSYQRPASIPFYALRASYVEAIVVAAKNQRPQPQPTG